MAAEATKPPRAVAAALALLAILAFANATGGEFLYDDFPYVVDNPQVQQPTARRLLLEPLSGRPELGLYRPLPLLTYALQARGRGRDAPTLPFHLFNLICHAGVTLLVWQLGRRIGLGGGVAALGAAFFAIHPCHIEPVDWIVGRAELLAALFGLGFLVVALKEPAARRTRDVLVAALLLALAGLSKESAFALPGVLVVIELSLGRDRSLPALVKRHWPWAVVLAVLIVLRFEALGRFGPETSTANFALVPWFARPLVSAQLLGEYFLRSLLPLPPRIFFHRSEFQEFAWPAALGFAAWIALLVIAWKRRPLRAALLAFPVALATVLNLWPIQETFAERFLYLPSAFVLLPAAAPLAALVRSERETRGRAGTSLFAPAAAIALLLGFTWAWNPIFDSALRLWPHNVAQAPDLPFPHYQFAFFLHDHEIFTPRDADTPGALDEYETALAKNRTIQKLGYEGMPADQAIRAHLSIASIVLERLPEGRRDPARAKRELDQAIAIGESVRELDVDLGRALVLYAQLRHWNVGVTGEQAQRALERALELQLAPASLQTIREELARLRGQ